MTRLFWVCLGGAIGTGARYLVAGWFLRVSGPGFPWGTLAVNAVGSFLLGVILQVSLTTKLIPPTLVPVLTTGVMGGFTTYSTFNHEVLRFFEEDAWMLGFVYLGATVAGCLLAGALGLLSGRLLAG